MHQGPRLPKDAVPDPHKKLLTVDIGLDQGKSHYSDEWRSTQPLLTDLGNVGLVPAFIVGDVHAAHLPDRYCRVLPLSHRSALVTATAGFPVFKLDLCARTCTCFDRPLSVSHINGYQC